MTAWLGPAVRARLDELADRDGLPEQAADRLGRLLGLLAEDGAAPTSVREPNRAVDVHVADSLAGLQLSAVRDARQVADLGSGAGFPGLVLAVALPEARVALVESDGRKAAFLARAVEAVGAANVEVVRARAEAWRAGTGVHDLVTARALAGLPVLVEYAAPLLARGGRLVAWKGHRDAREEADGAAAAAVTGLEPAGVVAVRPFPWVQARSLYLYSKERETPSRFPRREGMARKRPLRASA
ncbi:MAG TPA: 16S rRNA (guanine(527)-N(7))-methyltransferase RsmG [Solirubrobacteraceae bacterium]|nr:16S rRNA (guanine(527)-N(7))-methyltransferase RsmG [Solirubrobacteraceae bacterium]